MHRVTWDMHYQPLDPVAGENEGGEPAAIIGGPELPIAAIKYNTVPAPTTPWANPGQFTVRLTVNGATHTQPLTIRQDPRVKTPALYMQQVYTLSKAMYYEALDAQAAIRQATALREAAARVRPQATGAIGDAIASLDAKLARLTEAGNSTDTLGAAAAGLARVMNVLQEADVRPTAVQLNAIARERSSAARVMTQWRTLNTVDLVALNARLNASGLPILTGR
jgi:hypothetical protein